jgi:two-component system LytT family sensor kinase
MHDRPVDPSLREIPPGGRTTEPQQLPERGIGARWFWTLQICGWGFYAGQKYLAAGVNLQTYVHFALLIFLAWGLHLVYRRVFRVRRLLGVEVLIVVGSSLVSGFLLLVLGDVIYRQMGFITSPLGPLPEYLGESVVISLTHFKSLTLLTWSAVYLVLVYGLDVERERQASLQARALSHQAQLEMLRNQLSPHFLFNALNSMSVLIREDPARAEQMLDELSEFLRYSLASTKVQQATLADEVDVIRRYLAIQQIRFEEKLQVTWDVDERALSCVVPAFLLHPLVENAVKYGMQTSALPLQVGIRIERAEGDGRVVVDVSNSGAWVSSDGSDGNRRHHLNGAGLGLEIVRRRLEQRYPDTHSLVIGERQGRVHAVVELPPAAA